MRGGTREGAGRPKLSQDKLKKTRAIRLTDCEYIKVKEFLKMLRGESEVNSSGEG